MMTKTPDLMMKIFPTKLLAAMAMGIAGLYAVSGVLAQEVPPSIEVSMQAEIDDRRVVISGFALSFEDGKIIYSDNDDGFNRRDVELEVLDRIYILELPEDIEEALEAYHSGAYADAVTKLRAAAARYASLRGLELAGVKEMEVYYLDSLRRSGRYDDVRQAYDRVRIAEYRPEHQAVIRIIPAWHAWSRQNWDGVHNMLSELNPSEMPIEVAAQIAFLRAEAHRGLGESSEALTEYHRAAILDRTRDEDMLEKILKGALETYLASESLEEFFSQIRAENYSPNAEYNIKVREGAWIMEFAEQVRPNNMQFDLRFDRLKEARVILQSAEVKRMETLGGEPAAEEAAAVSALLGDSDVAEAEAEEAEEADGDEEAEEADGDEEAEEADGDN